MDPGRSTQAQSEPRVVEHPITSEDPANTGSAPALSPDFRHLFESEFSFVCRALQRLGVRQGDLKDVAQELFVAVYHRLGEYDGKRPCRPWLFSFALRFAANYRRLMRNRAHVSDEVLHSHEQAGSNHEARDLVLRALAELDFDRRVVIVMHDLEGFAAPDIAAELGLVLNTVYSRLRLARADFKNAIVRLEPQMEAT